MSGFPAPSASKMGNLIVNPGGVTPGALEVYLREWRWSLKGLGTFAIGGAALREGPDDNVIIPQAEGRRGYRQFLDQGVYTSTLRVTGEAGVSGVAPSGTNPARHLIQLRANWIHLRDNIHRPPSGATRAARLILPDATAIDFAGQFALSFITQRGAEASYILDVTVPDGMIE